MVSICIFACWERETDRDTISKRPGRRRAPSIALGRLVAANTIIPCNKKNQDTLLMNRQVDMLRRIMLKTISKLRSTVAISKPSISVNIVDKSLSPTVALPLEFLPGPVLQGHTSPSPSYFIAKLAFSEVSNENKIHKCTNKVHINWFCSW